MSIGAELELIPFDVETLRIVPVDGGAGKASLPILRDIAAHARWIEVPAGSDAPSWILPGGDRVSFEPGGQIELSSATSATASALIRDLQCAVQLMTASFERDGILLEAVGVDPYNRIEDIELQLHRPRYERMTRYFDSIGQSGARMMRQTASLQINVEAGANPHERWALLNSLAPYITAIFSNSPMYERHANGQRSQRAYLWRTLDPTRTGLPLDRNDPAGAYTRFALDAGAMMYGGDAPYPSFADWLLSGEPTIEDWDLHLTTLFPEVRPRHYFELRSADAIPAQYLAAPIAFVTGLVYDAGSARDAAASLGVADSALLETAGRVGLA
ncbi:MAG: glutamate-cysteine ligase family protein, partial [Gemmatimonadales bacterium]